MKNHILLAAASILLTPCSSFAQAAATLPTDTLVLEKGAVAPLSLQSCITQGVENNFQILIKREQAGVAKNNATLGNAGLLPTIELSATAPGTFSNSYTDSREEGSISSTGDYVQQLNSSLNLSWTLFNGMSAQATYAKLKELSAQGELATRIAIENLVADIATSYYQIVRQERRLQILNKSLDLSAERVAIVNTRQSVGAASKLEYQQAEVDYNADRTDCVKQAELIYRSQVGLNELMALEEIAQATKLSDYEITFYPLGDRETLWAQVAASNAYLLSAERDRNISKEELRIAKARSYPYLRLNGSYGYGSSWYNTTTIQQRQQLSGSVGLTVGVTLFDGNNMRRQRTNAKSQIKIAELETASLELSLKADLANLWMAYCNNKVIVEMEQKNVATAGEYLDIAMYQYKLEVMSGLQLREAQNSYLAAEDRLLTAEYEAKLCEISLLLLSGEILTTLL
ncbi:MAG: TolC family protein [Phocaeicola sp.]